MPKHTKKSYHGLSSKAQRHQSRDIEKRDAQQATELNLQSPGTSSVTNGTPNNFNTSDSSDDNNCCVNDNALLNKRREHLQSFSAMVHKEGEVNRNKQGQYVTNLNQEDQLEGSSQPSADIISLKQRGSIAIPYKSKVEKSRKKRKKLIKSKNLDCIPKRSKVESPTRKKEGRHDHSSKNLDCIPHKLARSIGKKKDKRNKKHSSENPCRIASAGLPKLIPIVAPKRIRIEDSDISQRIATTETRRNLYLGKRPPTPYSRKLVSLEEERMIVISDDTSTDDQRNEPSPDLLHFADEGMINTPYETVQVFNIANPTPVTANVIVTPYTDYLSRLPSSSPSDNEENATQFDVSINEVLQHIEKLLASQANIDFFNNDQHHDAGPSKSRQPNRTRDPRLAASRSGRSGEGRPSSQTQRLRLAKEKTSVLRQYHDESYPASKPNRSKQYGVAVEAPIAFKSSTSKAKRNSYYSFVFATNILSYGIPNSSPIKIDFSSPIAEFNKWWNDNCKHFYKSEEAAQKRYRLARAIIERSICRYDENPSENAFNNTSFNSSMQQVQSPPIITDQILSSPRPIRPLPRIALKEVQTGLYDLFKKIRENYSRHMQGASNLYPNAYLSPNHVSAFVPNPATVPRKRPIRRELFPDPPVDMCGVTLSREDYYTIPAVKDLALHKSLDDRCIIEGFIVGRIDYGHVYFPEPIDVTGLNLDEIVHFEIGAITMYPNEDQTPPVGEGLNRPAHVSLENVFPKSESGIEIRDVKALLHMDYTRTLRSICERNDLKFISYIPENGSWIFTVDHFCTYGLKENDSNEGRQAENIAAINRENDEFFGKFREMQLY